MEYKFTYKNTANDFWLLSIYFMYGSIVGICNLIFTTAMILLSIKSWENVSVLLKVILILACILFPIMQPLGIYIRAKRQAAKSRQIVICFNDLGIQVKSENEKSEIKWNSIKRVSKKPSMIVVFSTTTHGFIVTNKVLGGLREEFYQYVISKMNRV